MLTRIPIAFAFGVMLYLLAVAMTVYDGALSMLFQPIIGAFITAIALLVLCVAGSWLLLPAVWTRWRRAWWLSVIMVFLGFAACVASWHPALREQVTHRETQATVESFHPALALGGWAAVMFGTVFCPVIGFRADRRWV